MKIIIYKFRGIEYPTKTLSPFQTTSAHHNPSSSHPPIPALQFLQTLTYAVPFLPRDQPQIICKKNLKFGINSEETP